MKYSNEPALNEMIEERVKMENRPINVAEQSTNMALLTEALRTRGFFVTYLANRILLQPGSGRNELQRLQRLFKELCIDATYREEMVILHNFQITEELTERISFFRAYNHESNCPQYMSSWKSFTKRKHGFKFDTLTLDAGIAYLVKSLSKAGILTEMSCDGHGRSAPRIWLAGGWNAAWFEINCNPFLSGNILHYRWLIEEERGHLILSARRRFAEKWNLAYVQEDAMKLGAYLDQHAEEMSKSKRRVFKYRSMKKQALLLAKDYKALKEWMEERALIDCNEGSCFMKAGGRAVKCEYKQKNNNK